MFEALTALFLAIGGAEEASAPPLEIGPCELVQIGCAIPSSGWHTVTYACPLADWSLNVPGECPAGEEYASLVRWWDAEAGEWVEP